MSLTWTALSDEVWVEALTLLGHGLGLSAEARKCRKLAFPALSDQVPRNETVGRDLWNDLWAPPHSSWRTPEVSGGNSAAGVLADAVFLAGGCSGKAWGSLLPGCFAGGGPAGSGTLPSWCPAAARPASRPGGRSSRLWHSAFLVASCRSCFASGWRSSRFGHSVSAPAILLHRLFLDIRGLSRVRRSCLLPVPREHPKLLGRGEKPARRRPSSLDRFWLWCPFLLPRVQAEAQQVAPILPAVHPPPKGCHQADASGPARPWQVAAVLPKEEALEEAEA